MRTLIILLLTTLTIALPTSAKAATPPLDGTFLDIYGESYTGITLESLPGYLDELRRHNLKTIVIMDLARKNPTKSCKDAEFIWADKYKEKLTLIFAYAQQHDFVIYTGVVSAWSACPNAHIHDNLTTTIPLLKDYSHPDNPITYIHNTFGNHQNFGGWYIPDEPYLGSWSDPNLTTPYWKQYAEAIRAKSSKPILVAPPLYLAYDSYTPSQIAQRASDFKQQTGIEIQAWQDSVNATGFPNKSNSLNQYSVRDYYLAISQAIGRDNFWADIEVSNCCIAVGGGIQGGGYNGTTAASIKNQLDNAPTSVVSKRVAWIAQYHLTEVNSRGRYGAGRALRSYAALFHPSSVGTQIIKPLSYTWTTPPHSSYPDSGNEMFDQITGLSVRDKANNHQDPAYVGFTGNASVTITLDQEYKLRDVGVHLLNQAATNVLFPHSILLSCSTDNSSWTQATTFNHGFTRTHVSELVLGSDKTPLDLTCRYLRLTLDNDTNALTLISEIELVGTPLETPISYFADTPVSYPHYQAIEALRQNGIVGGCATNPNRFCPTDPLTRATAPYFLLRAMHGGTYSPPTPTTTSFTDVSPTSSIYPWVEAMKAQGITGGCTATTYCPNDPVTRAHFAIFVLRAKHGSTYSPPAATGQVFSDVPVSHPQAAWIEALKNQGITSGCGNGQYCPATNITRGEAAAFIYRAFNLDTPVSPHSSPTLKVGDANGDGRVDGVDYVVWLNNFNKSVSGGATVGDFDNNGKVDGVDYVLWLNNYGK